MKFIVLFLGLLLRPQAVSLARRFDREKVFRVALQNETQVNFLKELASAVQLNFWHPSSVHHVDIGADVDFQVSSHQANYVQTKLEQNDLPHEILFHNLQEEIEKQFDGGSYFRKKHSYLKYNDWDKIVAWTERITRNNPKLVSRIQIGKTFEGRPMYLLKVGKETGRKRVIFMECGIHAREWISPAFCQWFVKEATGTYGKDKEMTKLLDSLNFYVLPVFNVDGYVWTWTEDRTWRKNRSNYSDRDCIGTDLNRNFREAWCTQGASDDPCTEIYCGPSAESEQETKGVANFIRDHFAFIRGYISFHSYSQLLMFPYGYTYEMAPDHDELNRVAKGAVDALSTLYGTKYKYGPIAQTICVGITAETSYHPHEDSRGSHRAENKDDRDQLQQKKRNMKSLLASGLIAAAFVLIFAQSFDRAKVFRAKPDNEEQVSIMKYLASTIQLNFWYPDSALHIICQMEVDFHVSADQSNIVQTFLEKNKIQHEVLFPNLQEVIEKQVGKETNSTSRHSYTKYNEWHKISAWTARIAKKNPELVSRILIGNTFEKRPMYLLKVGKESGRGKAIFLDCGIHAREWISPAFCQWFLKEATQTYGKDQNMTNILNNMNFYILPVFNIDGYIWSWTQNRLWRKSRSKTSNSDCVGVDLNRNFGVAWGTVDSSRNPCKETYCGSFAESEPETKAVTTFIRNHLSSIKAYLTVHSYSQMLLFPYGYTYDDAPNHDELNEVAKGAVKAISSLYGEEYKYGSSAITIYPSSGCSEDWAYSRGIKYSFAFELRDKGRYGFLLPESQIKPTCQETVLAVKFIANYVLHQALQFGQRRP